MMRGGLDQHWMEGTLPSHDTSAPTTPALLNNKRLLNLSEPMEDGFPALDHPTIFSIGW
jgi:hypothetical protein